METEVDEFGDVDTHKWMAALHRFIWTKLLPNSTLTPQDAAAATQHVLELLEKNWKKSDARRCQWHGGGAVAYEEYCAETLRRLRWTVHLTPRTGDQGADVIASDGSTRVVIQCKHHRWSIGNKAVQEVAAAREFFDGDLAVVVASSGLFTASARQLARKLKVVLTSHLELNSAVLRPRRRVRNRGPRTNSIQE
jgi:restriction system protein